MSHRLTLAVAASLTVALALAPAAHAKKIPGQYIVTLEASSDGDTVAKEKGIKAKHVYKAALRGFAASLNENQLERLREDPRVAAIEQDQEVTASATQSAATWGLDRADQRALPLSTTYAYTATASNVTAYVIDTGLQVNHPQFGGRAANVYDALGGNGTDCNGHGTHVAGTIGGSTYGIAKTVKLRGVRVLGCDGSGTTSGIIAALDYVRRYAVKPAVANMSLGGGLSSALNSAATNLANSGVFLAVAAGNEAQNACNVSPASASAVFTTAASDRTDLRASFSNFGSCVEAYAPGVSITSSWVGSTTRTISGTSMATPHVAGVAALYKARNGDAPSATVSSWLIANSTANVVRSNPSGTPNRLLFKAAL